MPYALYVASVLGALALLLMMPRRGYSFAKLGGLLGAATLGGLWLYIARHAEPNAAAALQSSVMIYYYIFSAIAILSAVRVITHPKPVYSALWFVMVVLASAGLFIILGAEFMAFAMTIIYGGAILVTYLFVIMLASESGDATGADQVATYDSQAREPFAATVVGFVLLATLLSVIFSTAGSNLEPIAPGVEVRPSPRADDVLTRQPYAALEASRGNKIILQPSSNTEHVGLDLFSSHPLGLELAGVILLVSLIGAVVIARKQVERQAAG